MAPWVDYRLPKTFSTAEDAVTGCNMVYAESEPPKPEPPKEPTYAAIQFRRAAFRRMERVRLRQRRDEAKRRQLRQALSEYDKSTR